MAIEHSSDQATGAGECRRCRTFCDKMIEPRDCVAIGCPYVYSHEDALTGRQFVGCMRRVFSGEVDAEALRSPGGFGGIKVTGRALSHCVFTVEQAYPGDGPAHDCVNRKFYDSSHDGPEGIKAFDLRNVLERDQH